ncbi:MAG TPA: pilus assembly protein TadG-related protein [Rhodoblastus sp.]|nr:pilus assembly protein TadG-related protein [Rhodoblastus sp.]
MQNLYRFGTDRSGTVAVLFSVVLLPALLLVGAATDYARVVAAKAKLQSVADQAVLSAGLDVSGASDATLQAKARLALDAAFPPGSPVRVASLSLRTVSNTIVVSVDAATTTNFGKLFGVTSVATTTVAAVPKQTGRKMDVDFLLDASASMGLAATAAGRDRLIAAVGCAFACHNPEGGQTISNLQVAQNLGILTRLDVLKNAVGTMIGRIAATQGPRDTYRVAIDTFDDSPVRAVPITTNLASAQQFIQNYQLGDNTSFSGAMPLFTGDVGSQGDGYSTPKKFAIIVTDGVQGRRDRVGGFHPFDSRLCDSLKGQGVTVMVLNTKYIPMPTEAAYQQTVMPIQNQLEPALQACASTGYYFSAVDQADIDLAFNRIFDAIQARLRLVQ